MLTGPAEQSSRDTICRVPTQISFSNALCFPCFFPVKPQIFHVSIYVICGYYIHKTDLADLSRLKKKLSKYILILESGNLQLEQTKFLLFSPIGNYFGHFPCFPCFPCAVGILYFIRIHTNICFIKWP